VTLDRVLVKFSLDEPNNNVAPNPIQSRFWLCHLSNQFCSQAHQVRKGSSCGARGNTRPLIAPAAVAPEWRGMHKCNNPCFSDIQLNVQQVFISGDKTRLVGETVTEREKGVRQDAALLYSACHPRSVVPNNVPDTFQVSQVAFPPREPCLVLMYRITPSFKRLINCHCRKKALQWIGKYASSKEPPLSLSSNFPQPPPTHLACYMHRAT